MYLHKHTQRQIVQHSTRMRHVWRLRDKGLQGRRRRENEQLLDQFHHTRRCASCSCSLAEALDVLGHRRQLRGLLPVVLDHDTGAAHNFASHALRV